VVFPSFISICRGVLRYHHNWKESLVVKILIRKTEFCISFKATSLIRKLARATRGKKKNG